jgi:hypothetical protein
LNRPRSPFHRIGHALPVFRDLARDAREIRARGDSVADRSPDR